MVHADALDGGGTVSAFKGTLQHDGDPAEVTADKGGGLLGGTDQNDTVHPVADEEIEYLPDVPVLRPAMAEQHVIALLPGQLLQDQGGFGKQGIVQIGDHAADKPCPAGTESPGQQVGPIPVLIAKLQDPGPGLLADAPPAIERPGDGGDGYFRHTGDILDGNGIHKILPQNRENGCINRARHRAAAERGISSHFP